MGKRNTGDGQRPTRAAQPGRFIGLHGLLKYRAALGVKEAPGWLEVACAIAYPSETEIDNGGESTVLNQ